MIYDKGSRIKGALYKLVIQGNCPWMYDECLCLSCKVEDKAIVDDNVNVNGFHPQPRTDDNDNQGTCFADVNNNVDKIDSEREVDIYLLREKPPKVKPSRVSP